MFYEEPWYLWDPPSPVSGTFPIKICVWGQYPYRGQEDPPPPNLRPSGRISPAVTSVMLFFQQIPQFSRLELEVKSHRLSSNLDVFGQTQVQGCIFRLTCSHPELTKDHVLTSAYVKFFRTVTRNAVNKSVWRKKDCSWLPLNKHAMNIFI